MDGIKGKSPMKTRLNVCHMRIRSNREHLPAVGNRLGKFDKTGSDL
jgi:hypothetical protein